MAQSSKGLQYLKVINGSIQSKTYSFAVFTIVVVALLIAGAIRPTIIKITQINSEIKLKRQVNQELENKLNAIASLTNEYVTKENDMNALSLIFPAQGNYSLIMSNLEEISKANGFNLVGINFGSSDKLSSGTNVLKPWSVRITVKGNRANLIKFLGQLEEMPMYPKINRVSFTNNSDDDGQTSYSIELILYKLDESNFYQ